MIKQINTESGNIYDNIYDNTVISCRCSAWNTGHTKGMTVQKQSKKAELSSSVRHALCQ